MSKPTRPRQGPSSTSGTLRGLGRALAARLRRGKAPPEPLLPDLHLMVVDASVGAYGRWRDECAAVSDAYVSWRSAAPSEAADAYSTYRAALDMEERASEVYADAKAGRA